MYKIRNEMNQVYVIDEDNNLVGKILYPDIGENRVMIHKIMIDGNVKEDEILNLMLLETAKRLIRDGKQAYLVHPQVIEWFSMHGEYKKLIWKQKKA